MTNKLIFYDKKTSKHVLHNHNHHLHWELQQDEIKAEECLKSLFIKNFIKHEFNEILHYLR